METTHLIALDLDGTSVRYDPCLEMDPSLMGCLNSLRSNGVRWVINSDRYTETLIDIAKRLIPAERPVAVLSLQRFICMLNGDNVYVPCVDRNTVQTNKHKLLWDKISPFFDEWKQEIESKFDILESIINKIVFAYMVPTESIEDLRKMMNDFLLPFDDAKVSGNHDWSFMLHSSFSKAAVLLETAAKLGIDRENIVAVGDGLNDISMLNGLVTPKVGCPANASREVIAAVKKAGGIVSAKKSAAGTQEIIECYFG